MATGRVSREREEARLEKERKKKYGAFEKGLNSAMNTLGRETAKKIFRGLFGNRRR